MSSHHSTALTDPSPTGFKDYLPLITIVGIIMLTALTLAWKDYLVNSFSLVNTIRYFMIGVMVFSGLGVAFKLAKNEAFQCACLGTFLKVPLTKVTLIEDFGMAFLALVMLLI